MIDERIWVLSPRVHCPKAFPSTLALLSFVKPPRHLPLIFLAVADGGNILANINDTPADASKRDMWNQQMGIGILKLLCHLLVRYRNGLVRFLDIHANFMCLGRSKQQRNRQFRNQVFEKWIAKCKADHSGKMPGTIIERLCMTGIARPISRGTPRLASFHARAWNNSGVTWRTLARLVC